MARLLQKLFAVSLLAALSSGTAWDLCRGWSSSQSDRASCCEHMAHRCARWSADDCCEKGEPRRTRDLVPSVPQPARDMTPGALVTPAFFALDGDASLRALAGRPRAHLLHEVFLI